MADDLTRQLAAIMFADMVGYTALMQEDEQRARLHRDRQREVLERRVAEFKGSIIQYYGDGALSVFQSAILAVQCAVAVQQDLSQGPRVPVRIGLHIGDIAYDGDGAYGDGVNVASRIQALSVPGGILISGKVADEVKNHSSISTRSLGQFALKNVQRPQHVFAVTNPGIAVPAPKLSMFLGELKRRKVYRVAVVYAAVGVATSIAIPDLFGAFGFPDWAAPLVIVVIAIGFHIALILAWAYEVRPEEPRPAYADETEAGAPAGIHSPAGTVEEDRKSIAVLPFLDMSPDQDQEYFCDGMAEELIIALTKVKGLRVAARTSSFHFKGKSEDVREVGKQLAVRTVLEGSVRRAEDRLRVTAQLVSVEDGYHLWSENYDRELKDVFAVQDEISRSIVETLRPTLLGEEERELVVAPTRSMEAYDHYLLGRHYWEGRYETGLVTALRYFEKAVEIDPEYALPYTGVADSYTILGLTGYLRPEEARQRAMLAAQRAVALDEGLADAHASLGLYQMWLGWDWEMSAAEFTKAIELNPDHAKVRAWFGHLRGLQGRFEEAFDEAAVAQRLDPLSNYVASLSATVHTLAGDFATASEILERVVRRDPSYLLAVFLLSWTYSHMSRFNDAVQMGEKAAALSHGALHFRSWLGLVYGRAGLQDRARAILDDLYACEDSEYVSPLWLAWIHIGLGETERTLDLIGQAVAERTPYLHAVHQEPSYRSLWSNPRFTELVSQVGSGVVARAWDQPRERDGVS